MLFKSNIYFSFLLFHEEETTQVSYTKNWYYLNFISFLFIINFAPEYKITLPMQPLKH